MNSNLFDVIVIGIRSSDAILLESEIIDLAQHINKTIENYNMTKQIRTAIFNSIDNSGALFQDHDIECLSVEIYTAVAPYLDQPDKSLIDLIIAMRIAQKSYFRRKNEDTLSRAKRLEKELDLMLSVDSLPVQQEIEVKY